MITININRLDHFQIEFMNNRNANQYLFSSPADTAGVRSTSSLSSVSVDAHIVVVKVIVIVIVLGVNGPLTKCSGATSGL